MIFLVSLSWAHKPGLSYASVEGDQLALTFSKSELGQRIPLDDLDAARLLVVEDTLARVTLTADGQPCSIGAATLQSVENDGLEIRAPYTCPSGESWTFTAGYFDKLDAGHRQYLEAVGQPVAVLDAGQPAATFTGVPDQGAVAMRFLGLGVEHIWTGYDHLLFLFGLLLAAHRLKDMLLIVTGFTVAHSITLSLAALELLTLPATIVEPAIALTIALVGVENFFHPPARRRVWVTFFLGLIHGFGFAGMLTELGLPRHALVTALACFNGGVEIGQAAVVLLVLPILLFLRRFPAWERYAVPAASALIVVAGCYWFWERIG